MLPESAGGDGRLQGQFDCVVAALLGASAIPLVITVGLMAARAYRGGDRLEIRAGFRVQPATEPTHAVGSLPTQHQPAPAGAVLVGEVAVGIEAVGDRLPDRGDELRILFPCMAHQGPFGLVLVGGGHRGRQHVQCPAHRGDVVLTDLTGLHRGAQFGKLRREGRPGQ